ncbi:MULTISPECIES: transglutaminase-like cysteine peptidase [unclassified Neptuniibacter]|uniref:transglutaminase-like cysteine peptidase n=1 Tax=unclassified Neptuniibacter TaxID=2630693 RepID=UPI0025FAF31A|nr:MULTISPECIES: transglutaminase-like cysteine peptidase [unclassified Neptuniibacter]
MLSKVTGFYHKKLLHISVVALLYLHNPAHAGHFQKILPPAFMKKIQREQGQETIQRFSRWQQLLVTSIALTDREKLELVNNFFNEMKWVDDQELWGRKDYWATPIESLIKNAGDCEDFSIAKYFTLLEMGVEAEKLSISYVVYQKDNGAHMVLTYFEAKDSVPLILDNVENQILQETQRSDITPIYHLNSGGVWNANSPSERLGSTVEIKPWKAMLDRMRNHSLS